MALNILHISDIHFKDFKDHKFLDLDKEIQREIELDLKQLKAEYKNIDLVFLGGDIAFSGIEEEYKIAEDWIKLICEIIGCKEENVLTVPGNHDVERAKISPALKTIQSDFKSRKSRRELDPQIREYVENDESCEMLLRPLQNYNTFAQKYGSVSGNNNVLYWEKDFPLDNLIFRVRGLNSALVSNESDEKDKSKLFLGSYQSCFLREEGVIYAVLCHHPADWLIDGEDATRDFNAKARVHLFGHKHIFKANTIDGSSLILAAGAMQPSRRETGWEPRYNILNLSITDEKLKILVIKRIWDKTKNKFKAERLENGLMYEEFLLNLTVEENTTPTPQKEAKQANEIIPMAEDVIDPHKPNPMRTLAYLFLGLPYHTKIRIAVELGLVDDGDQNLAELQKAQAYLNRAKERNLLANLWKVVTREKGKTIPNPFEKK